MPTSRRRSTTCSSTGAERAGSRRPSRSDGRSPAEGPLAAVRRVLDQPARSTHRVERSQYRPALRPASGPPASPSTRRLRRQVGTFASRCRERGTAWATQVLVTIADGLRHELGISSRSDSRPVVYGPRRKERRHPMRHYLALLTALVLGSTMLAPGAAPAQSKADIVIGVQCDRSGPTQVVGTVLCPGFHDYIALVNSKGGIEGHKIKAMEVDHEYKVPESVEAYERFKQADRKRVV